MWYQLDDLSTRQYQITLASPKGAVLKFHLCPHPSSRLPCKNGANALACITVPGVKPTSTGTELKLEQLEPNIPSMGIRLVYENGEVCEVTKVPRKTIIKLPCAREAKFSKQNLHPKQAWEGKGKELCHYFVEFPPSMYGCPMESSGSLAGSFSEHVGENTVTTVGSDAVLEPEILAVTGCQDSDPARTTTGCHFAGKIRLVLHGLNFQALCDGDGMPAASMSSSCMNEFGRHFSVYVGVAECDQIALVSQYQINCTVERGSGIDLDVEIRRKSEGGGGDRGVVGGVVATIRSAVSFKERVNYKERFSKFVEMGVGGMKREINELYRRAFASRGEDVDIIQWNLSITELVIMNTSVKRTLKLSNITIIYKQYLRTSSVGP